MLRSVKYAGQTRADWLALDDGGGRTTLPVMPDQPAFETLEELAAATADRLAAAAAQFSFTLLHDKPFRRQARCDQLPTSEQDFIFNELLVAHLTLLMLTLEAPGLRVDNDQKDFLLLLQAEIPRAHGRNLHQLGVAAAALADWDELIDLRFEEYCRDRYDVRAAAMELAAAKNGTVADDLPAIQMLLPVQTVSIGCHAHVCRGQTVGRDELFKLILRALAKFYLETRVIFEGHQITPLMRLRMAVRRTLRRPR